MIKNYFIITFRNILRNKTFSFLNIFGLAVGIASAALIFLWVEDELNYNHYFPNRNNLYVVKDKQTYDGNTFVFDFTPGPLAQAIKSELPGIKTTARSSWLNPMLFSIGDKSIYENGRYIDSGFLTMFSVPFIKGNAAAAFVQLHSVVISEKMAMKFFKSTNNIIGKNLKVDNKQNYVISGVFKDLPENVSIKFDWLIPFAIYEEQNQWLKEWGSNSIITYAETESNANVAAINKQLYDIVQRKGPRFNAKIMLYPFNRIWLYNSFDNNGNEKEGVIKNIRLFSLIAWIILIIACINFMNLATAHSEKRAKEVGIRKVMGAIKQKLIVQFIAESVLLSFLSMLLAVAIISMALPAFNNLVHKNLSLQIFQPIHFGGLIIIALVCGILAGSYPAFYLSSFNPALVLKGTKLKTGSAAFIRKALVVTQFSASVILIICTVIIYQQIQYGKEKDLGFKKDNLITTMLHGNMRSHFSSIKTDLLNTGVVENTCMSGMNVLYQGSNTSDFTWEGKNANSQVLISMEWTSSEYISTQGMHLNEGRSFYENLKADSNNIIINETLAKIIHKKNILGTIINRRGDTKYTVVGVIKDFVSNNVYKLADPLILFADTADARILSIRIKDKAATSTAIAAIEKVIKNNNPGYPFEYEFVDAEFGHFFQAETLIGKLSGIFSALAIIISCLGLFSLASFTAERRTKEIGIRKVLGASVRGITGLLSKDFLKPVLLSVVIAFPVSWWMMFNWLKDYAYKITIQWWVFALAGLLVLLIALVTVSFQSIKAAIANPVKSLRTE